MDGPILVTGGTGTLGRASVERLRAVGRQLRVLSRHAGPGRCVGDLTSDVGIDDAVRGATAIVHCATGPRGDTALTRTLIDAARRSGNHPHLLYISIVGIDRVPLGYYREKLAVERLVEGAGLPWTIQRSTQFHDLLDRLFRALSHSPVLPVPAGTSSSRWTSERWPTGSCTSRAPPRQGGLPTSAGRRFVGPTISPVPGWQRPAGGGQFCPSGYPGP